MPFHQIEAGSMPASSPSRQRTSYIPAMARGKRGVHPVQHGHPVLCPVTPVRMEGEWRCFHRILIQQRYQTHFFHFFIHTGLRFSGQRFVAVFLHISTESLRITEHLLQCTIILDALFQFAHLCKYRTRTFRTL